MKYLRPESLPKSCMVRLVLVIVLLAVASGSASARIRSLPAEPLPEAAAPRAMMIPLDDEGPQAPVQATKDTGCSCTGYVESCVCTVKECDSCTCRPQPNATPIKRLRRLATRLFGTRK